VVAEGARYNAAALARYFEEHQERLGFDLRVTTLGHVQRGGAPSAYDRLLATRLAADTTERVVRGEHGLLVGLVKGEIAATPLVEVVANKKSLDPCLLELASIVMSRMMPSRSTPTVSIAPMLPPARPIAVANAPRLSLRLDNLRRTVRL
jgi:hypothetical protein